MWADADTDWPKWVTDPQQPLDTDNCNTNSGGSSGSSQPQRYQGGNTNRGWNSGEWNNGGWHNDSGWKHCDWRHGK